MTESQQHQEPIKHAQEHAESAIMAAQRAEAMLQDALQLADPVQIQSAQARLEQAKHDAVEARKHLAEFSMMEGYDQQLQQTVDELRKASKDIKASEDKARMPKQVR